MFNKLRQIASYYMINPWLVNPDYIPQEPQKYEPMKMITYGWQCPNCGRVFSPDTKECPYCKFEEVKECLNQQL